MIKEELKDKLNKFFNMKDPYVYQLTRTKEAFQVGTMTLDDFEEIDDNFIDELAYFILEGAD
jgi:hypothetical protein